jgi:hypothetical protein
MQVRVCSCVHALIGARGLCAEMMLQTLDTLSTVGLAVSAGAAAGAGAGAGAGSGSGSGVAHAAAEQKSAGEELKTSSSEGSCLSL